MKIKLFSKVKFINNQKGATAIEYGLIAALIAVASIVAFIALGDSVQEMFNSNATAVEEVVNEALD